MLSHSFYFLRNNASTKFNDNIENYNFKYMKSDILDLMETLKY